MRRIDQLLSSLGYCTRSEARDWVDDERIEVDGRPARSVADKVDPARVLVDDEPLDHPDGLLLVLNKPLGLVCSHDDREGPSVYGLLPPRWRRRNPVVTSIGRLDKDTSGLILLTDQSPLVHRLTSPKHKVAKLYVATLDRAPEPAERAVLGEGFTAGGLVLEGEKEPCAPARLAWRSDRVAELELTEGRYHQVRRMFAHFGLLVTALHRERFGHLGLGELSPGAWRALALDEFDSKKGG